MLCTDYDKLILLSDSLPAENKKKKATAGRKAIKATAAEAPLVAPTKRVRRGTRTGTAAPRQIIS